MPQVPAGTSEQQIVRRQGGPTARVSSNAPIEAFGGGASTAAVGRAATQLGEQALNIAREEKQKADDVATTEAYTKTVQLRNKLMYDPQQGAMNRKGKDAFGVGEEYGTQFQQAADEIESSLTNDEQRAMYKRIREQELRDLEGNLTRHTFQQAQAYEEETTQASLLTQREDAVMNYQDPAKVQQSLAMQKNLIMAQAQRNGASPEVIEARMKDAESKTHEAVINRMLANGQDMAASEYYKNVKPAMLGSDATQLERALEEGSLRGQSQRNAIAITTKNGDLSSALAAVDKIKDQKLQDATRERVKQRFSEREQAINYASEQAFRGAYSIAEKTRRKDDIPPDVWASMSPSQKSSIDAYLAKDTIQTDWNDYYNLKTMASSTTLRDKFLTTDLLQYRHKLGDTEFKELVNAQAEAKKGDTKALDGFRNDQQIVNDSLAEAGIDPTPKSGSKDSKTVNQFRRRVDEEVAKRQQATGQKVSNEEMQGIVDGLMIKGITERGFFWDTEKHFFEIEKGVDKQFDFDVKAVPPAERQKIESALKAKGIEVTDDKVVGLYRRKLAGMVGARRGN